MERTQLYIPKTYKEALRREAQKRQTTVSGIVRFFVERGLREGVLRKSGRQKRKTFFDALREIEKLGERGPRDLATNLDKYLYGGK